MSGLSGCVEQRDLQPHCAKKSCLIYLVNVNCDCVFWSIISMAIIGFHQCQWSTPEQHGKVNEWASYQIRKIAGCACAGNAGNVFPATAGQRFPTCITARAWRNAPVLKKTPFCNRHIHVCTFLLQNGATWDRHLMHCGICEIYHLT